jgi:hypothetical protein
MSTRIWSISITKRSHLVKKALNVKKKKLLSQPKKVLTSKLRNLIPALNSCVSAQKFLLIPLCSFAGLLNFSENVAESQKAFAS